MAERFENLRRERRLYTRLSTISILIILVLIIPFTTYSQFMKFKLLSYFILLTSYGFAVIVTYILLIIGFAFVKGRWRWLLIISVCLFASSVALLVYFTLSDKTITQKSWSYVLFMHYFLNFFPISLIFSLILYQSRTETLSKEKQITHAKQDERRLRDLAEMKLRVLQAQIEPHFLFNTLAHLDALIEDDPSEASILLGKFITYLRGVTPLVKKAMLSLDEEITLSRSYLDIQLSRLGGRMSYDIKVVGKIGSAEIPSFIILTLVENAVKHAIEKTVKGGHIDIEIKKELKALIISVNNTGLSLESDWKSGTGLRNIKQRLESLYEGSAKMSLQTLSDDRTSAVLTLPIN